MYKSTKKSKQLESIKKKLAAATAMLMVASTMMVSSTYAWFTLSTAPEVTGISTTVGANGNLEIALANNTGDASMVKSTVGDSFEADEVFSNRNAKNMTWGNLVDLSSPEYGLEEVVLLPASLNTLENDTMIYTSNPLKIPYYGADGRVDELKSNTVTAKYVDNAWQTNSEATMNYGVRAIGSMSGQSETTVAFRDARSKLAEYAQSAKSTATNTLQTNGGELGNIIVDKVLKDDAKFTQTQVDALGNMITGLEKSLTYIDDALQYAALGRAASADFEDTNKYEAVKAAIAATDATAESVLKVFYGTVTVTDGSLSVTPATTIPTVTDSSTESEKILINAYNKYVATVADVATAKYNFNNKGTGTSGDTEKPYQWSDISATVNSLVDINKVKVNGMTADEIKATDPVTGEKTGMDAFVENVTSNGNNVVVSMYTGSGVIADIADLAGDYSAGITISEISYAGLTLKNFKATMNTKSTVSPDHLSSNSAYILNRGAMSTSAEGNNGGTFTDTYGYAIDLFFRTNVVGSDLQLQTKPVDRVYADESVEGAATMGSGSTMTFTTTNEQVFNRNQMMDLMNCIRLVFVDKDGTILARAALDADAAQQTESGTAVTLEASIYTTDKDGNFASKKTDVAKLTSLTQNEAKLVSVLVYLDGDKVDNTMVANASTSMTGSLNLQFSSSANLVPMENNQIRDLAASGDTESNDETTTYTVSAAAATLSDAGVPSTIDGVTVEVTPTSAKAGDTVTVTLPETPTGYTFSAVKVFNDTTVDTSVTVAEGTDGTYTFTMPSYNASVIAVYTAATT